MAAVISQVQLMVLSMPEALEWSKEQWAQGLKDNAERMNEKRKAKIPNANEFSAKLAGPSSLSYAGILNPGFVSRSGSSAEEIVASQYSNLKNSYQKYSEQLDYMFETVDGVPAKRFKDQVDLAKEDWSKGAGARTLAFTGSKVYAYGLSTLAGMWLTADPRIEGALRGGDVVVLGGPKLICFESAKPSLRTFLNQRLIQAGATLVKQDWLASAITKQNDLTNALLNGYRDPALNIEVFTTGGDSHVDWVRVGEAYYLEVQVAVTP